MIIGIPASLQAGAITMFTLTALDAYGNSAIHLGTVHFSSSDASANLPDEYTFVAKDGGTHVFAVVFNGFGTQSLTAGDSLNPSISSTREGIVVT